MLRRNASGYLQQIPAESIERIEIITNPSAQYRTEGVGGIVNIVLKKDADNGLNGLVSANIGTEERINGNINLNYGGYHSNWYGTYAIRHANTTNLYSDERYYIDPGMADKHYTDDKSSTSNRLSHTMMLGCNYDIGDYDNIEITGTYFLQNSLKSGVGYISETAMDGHLNYAFENHETNDEFEGEGEASLAYEHIFQNSEDHSLTLEFALSEFKETEYLSFEQINTVPNPEIIYGTIGIFKTGSQKEILLDYALPIGEDIEFEAGYAGEYVFENLEYSIDSSNQFHLNQNIHAAYGLWSHSIGDMGYSLGLRAEQTRVNSHLLLPADTSIVSEYFKLFPTLHLSYELSDHSQLSMGYSKRINRPDADELNPNPEFNDPRNAESGNPKLRPEQTHSFEIGYQHDGQKYSVIPTFYYRYKYDAFTEIQRNINDSIVLTTITNLDNSKSTGIELVINGRPIKNLEFDIAGNVYYAKLDASELDLSTKNSAVSGNLKFNTKLELKSKTLIQAGTYYYFPSITPQGQRKSYYYINTGFKQPLFEKRAALTVTLTDLLHTYKVVRTIDSRELIQKTSKQRKLPIAYIGFSWNFNYHKEKNEFVYETDALAK